MMVHRTIAGKVVLGKLGYRQQNGWAYIAVLFFVVAVAVSLTVVTQDEYTIQQREKERDWLFIGEQYQRAIKSYYAQSPNGLKEYPKTVDDLLLDKRFVAPVRHLRKPYLDPITGKDWLLMLDEDKRIQGVFSASSQLVLLTQAVTAYNSDNVDQTHSDIKFHFKPNESTSQARESGDDTNVANDDDNNIIEESSITTIMNAEDD